MAATLKRVAESLNLVRRIYNHGDRFNPPVIHHVERQGKRIHIQASMDEDGKAAEKGEGIKGKGERCCMDWYP